MGEQCKSLTGVMDTRKFIPLLVVTILVKVEKGRCKSLSDVLRSSGIFESIQKKSDGDKTDEVIENEEDSKSGHENEFDENQNDSSGELEQKYYRPRRRGPSRPRRTPRRGRNSMSRGRNSMSRGRRGRFSMRKRAGGPGRNSRPGTMRFGRPGRTMRSGRRSPFSRGAALRKSPIRRIGPRNRIMVNKAGVGSPKTRKFMPRMRKSPMISRPMNIPNSRRRLNSRSLVARPRRLSARPSSLKRFPRKLSRRIPLNSRPIRKSNIFRNLKGSPKLMKPQIQTLKPIVKPTFIRNRPTLIKAKPIIARKKVFRLPIKQRRISRRNKLNVKKKLDFLEKPIKQIRVQKPIVIKKKIYIPKVVRPVSKLPKYVPNLRSPRRPNDNVPNKNSGEQNLLVKNLNISLQFLKDLIFGKKSIEIERTFDFKVNKM